MRSHRWRSVQSGLPESARAHGCPELVKHALLVEANGMCRNIPRGERTTRLKERADDRDSEPDYLLRPTRHGPGGTLHDY